MWASYPQTQGGQPIEVKYSLEDDGYLVFAGTRRVKDAQAQGERYLPAFVEADNGAVGAFAIVRRRSGEDQA
jgi:ParB-like chromosome segregation protein Spo0J